MNESIENSATPEGFISALRRIAQRCYEDAGELQSAWQDRNAGSFWKHAARELERVADKLEGIAL